MMFRLLALFSILLTQCSLACAQATLPSPASTPSPAANKSPESEPLGKLFLTPERRAALERQRQLNIREAETLEGEVLRLNGVVQRSNGRSTVWVNNRAQHDSAPEAPISAKLNQKSPGTAKLSAGNDPEVRLRVGESINRATQERSDVVTTDAVRVGKPLSR